MFDLTYWIIFLTAALAISISPGPDLIYILSRTISYGKKFGFCSSLGVGTGALVHIFLVAFGLAAILEASLLAFTIVKIAGAIYLVFLGVKAILSKGQELIPFADESKKQISAWDAYKQGILVDVLNPKAAIFFMAFLPQFTRPKEGVFAGQIIFLGILVIMIGFLVEGCVILLTHKVAEVLIKKASVTGWVEKIMGSILIGLGISLALSSYQA
jgi:threonine/homoserine/homoserine lactone efflux protein